MSREWDTQVNYYEKASTFTTLLDDQELCSAERLA